MWFIFAILTALSWGCADLFYKKGSNPDDKFSHLKIVIMVGLVMGIHGVFYMVSNNLTFDFFEMIRYLPVSFFYILSMTIGYIGLRYIALSISSPIQNSSGVITSILLFAFFSYSFNSLELTGIFLITVGVILLGILERKYEIKEIKNTLTKEDKKYQIGFLAIMFPIIYAILDGTGTFLDGVYLDEMKLITEDNALLAYEFTFAICAVISYIYLRMFKKIKINLFKEKTKLSAALFETVGQYFYVFAMAKNAIISAPLIASYSIFSIILSRLFLKEKLTKVQYLVIVMVMLGIILLGVSDEL
ncbi:hypothetical protein DCE79_09285 [Lysinibacillus sp. 2017]|uniref:EamA family transporter n=1 Tax=unclassified Lysinibacillus TaxID=2636778 RepID=UPI000D525994|nr:MULTISPECIES: EamA family transporter [unclassified Lysinibacillus]AWE07559.1 hypothetical protein DCE79_09285 [Lysinibacillus sp. 2017]TGN36722.1 hypothetical protein E4L99_03990 [Lysinibacillus sp. S2017]